MFPVDLSVAASLAAARTDGLTAFFATITNLGEVWFCIFAASLICLFLYAARQQKFVPELLVISLGSAATVWALKIFFALPRPSDPIALMTIDSFSFPSGHAAAAATLYGFLLWMMLGTGTTDRVRTLAAGIFFMIIVLVGFSRMYLGVHYLSDVIAGYVIGFVWVMIGVSLARSKKFTRFFAR
ncbi:phosphatase PAP2 family protein [bacterium]|nr:phosphatase PAP2 family protein [bacterium]